MDAGGRKSQGKLTTSVIAAATAGCKAASQQAAQKNPKGAYKDAVGLVVRVRHDGAPGGQLALCRAESVSVSGILQEVFPAAAVLMLRQKGYQR